MQSTSDNPINTSLDTPELAVREEVYFIDASVPDPETLIAGMGENAEIVFIRAGSDGVEQMANYLSDRSDIDAIHVISHGSEGAVYLGDSSLSNDNLEQYQAALKTIGSSLSENGDILLYGCSVAGDEDGQDFVRNLALATNADIAASDDITGQGGDWVLEQINGHIETDIGISQTAQAEYAHSLATFDFESVTDNGASISQTVSGVTLTVSSDVSSIDQWTAATYFGETGKSAYAAGNVNTVTFTFDKAVDVTSIFVVDSDNSANTWTFTPTGGSNSNVTSGSVPDLGAGNPAGATVNLNWTGVTSFTVTEVGTFLPSFDTLIFTPPSSDPTITNSTYNASTGVLVVTGTNFAATVGAANDVVANKFTLTGEGGGTHTLTDTANVEIDSSTQFTLTLSATDKAIVNQMLNKDGGSSTGGTTYDLDGAVGFIAASGAIADTGVNGITTSNVAAPTITNATFDYTTGVLNVTGTGFLKLSGATNDINVSKLTILGNGSNSHTLTSNSVEITSGTNFSVTLNATDIQALRAILNNNGATAADVTTYNLAAAEDWNAGADVAVNIADLTLNGITVSNFNASPVLDLDGNDSSGEGSGGFLTSFSEGGSAVAIADSDVSATDAETNSITTITITLTNDQDGASEGLNVSAAAQNALTGISGASDIALQDTITISGATATLAEVQTFLQAVTYSNTSSTPNTTQRTVTVVLNDGTSNSTTVTTKVNVSDITAASSTGVFNTTTGANLSPGIIFGSGNETLTIASAGHETGATINGGTGTDELILGATGIDLSGATTVTGFETLSLGTNVSASMTEAQHDAFTTINGNSGVEQITITDAVDGLTGSSNIETYVLGAANAFTIGTAGQNITGSSGNDTVNAGSGSYSGTWNANGGSDTIVLQNGANISSATISNFETLSLVGSPSVTMTESQHDSFTNITGGGGADQITISDSVNGLTGDADIETYVLGAANSFTLGAAAQNVTGSTGNDTINAGALTLTGTLDGQGGSDELNLSDGANLAGATVSGIETLSVASGASVSMTEAQHDAFSTINGTGTNQITITASTNGFQTDADIETYVLGAANAVTVTGAAQVITGSTGNDTITLQGLTTTGTLAAGTGTDILQMTTGSNISGAVVSGFETLTLAGNASVTMTESQFESFATINAAGSETITLASMDGNATITAHANIESYVLGAAATIALVGNQSVTGSTGDDTVGAGAQTLTGTLNGGTGTNTLLLSNGGNISGATLSNFQNLTIASGASVTMTTAQLNSITGTITATGTETIILTDTGTLSGTNLGAIEVLSTKTGGTESVTLSASIANNKTLTAADAGTDSFVVTASAGAQTINGSAGNDTIDGGAGADTILGGAGTDSLTGGADNDVFQGSASDLNGDSITDLAVGDQIRLTGVTGLSTSNIRFNGNNLEIDTDATTFAAPEVSLNLGSDQSTTLKIETVADAGADTLITIGAFNEAPVFTGLDGAPTFTENGSAVVLDSNVTVADTELDALNGNAGNYNGAKLTIARNGGASANDSFGLQGGTLTESGNLTVASTNIGTVTTNSGGTLVLTFNASATSALVDQALQAITYSNSSEAPAASVTLDWTFNDGTSNSTGTNQTAITVTAVNDAPVLDNNQSPALTAINEDVTSGANAGTNIATLVVDNSISDADGSPVEAIAVTAVDNTNGNWQYSTDNGTNWNDFSATTGQSVDISSAARLLDGTLTTTNTQLVRFVPNANYAGNATITFRAWDKTSGSAGSTADTSTTGGITAFSSTTDTAAITVNNVNDAPTASDTTKAVTYNSSYTFSTADFGFSDVDTGDTLDHITITALPDKGTLKLDGNNVSANDDITSANIGNLTFTPDNGGAGPGYTSFTFTVNDGTTDSASANTVTVDVGNPPAPATPTTTNTVDGATVTTQETNDSQGNTVEVVTISPITPSRQDSDSTSTGADVPFQFLDNDPNKVVTTLSLPTGLGAQVRSNTTANTQNQADNLITLIRDTGGDDEDSQDAQNAVNNFLNAGNSNNTWVNSVTLTSTGSTASTPVLITGTSDTTQREAVVIDTRSVSGGTQIQLNNIEYSFISGQATVSGGAGQNYVHGDDSSQFIRLGADDDELHGGGGNDIIGSQGGDDLLYGDRGEDFVFGGTGHDTLHGGADNDILQGGQSTQGTFTFFINADNKLVTTFAPDDAGNSDIAGLSFTGDWYSQAVLVLDGKAQGIDFSEGNISSVMEAGLMLQASSDYAFLSMDGERLEMLAAAYQGIFGERLNASDLTGLSGSQYSLSELADIGIQAWITQQGSDFSSLTAEQQVSAFLSSFWNASEVTDQAIADVLSNLSNGMSAGELFLSVAQSQQAKDKLTTDQGLLQLTVSNKVSENGLSTDIGNDSLFGEAGNDTLVGGHGNDLLDGGEGTDTAVQLHNFAEYSIAQLDNGSITLTYQQGAYTEVDTLVDIEFVQFGDQLIGVNDLI